MKALMPLMFVLATAGSTEAHAGPHDKHGHHRGGPPPVGVVIDNEAGTEVQVYLDGHWRGAVRRGDERTFTSVPGRHDLRVVGSRGEILHQGPVVLTPSRMPEIDVRPALATLRLHNDGDAPLLVQVSRTESFWLMPGSCQTLETRAGMNTITTSMATPRGMVQVGSTQVDLLGGRTHSRDVGWHAPPANSRITVTNGERGTIRVYAAGREIGAVPSGATRTLEVGAGQHMLTVVEHGGRVLYNQPQRFDGRTDHTVLIANGRTAFHAATPQRPLYAYR